MTRFLISLAVLTLAVPAFPQLSDSQVSQAIENGNKAGRHPIGLTLNDVQTSVLSHIACHTCGVSGYTITVYNPDQWIALRAQYARSEMEPFDVKDVTDEMRAPVLHVVALPSRADYLSGSGIGAASSVHRVVLNDTARQTTIQPLDVRQSTLQSNSALRSFEYTMASADFALSDVARLRASDAKGEFFIVVVGDNQNKFFKVKERMLNTLFYGRTTVPDSPGPAPGAASVVPVTVPSPAEAAKAETVWIAVPGKLEDIPLFGPAEAAKAEAVLAAQSQPMAGGTAPSAATSPATKLQIVSIPLGADIEVDGRFVGRTPSDAHVAEGEHTVVIRKSGFRNWKRKLKSTAGTSEYVIAELETNNP